MNVSGQLKVEPNGSVGLGTLAPNTGYVTTIDQKTVSTGGILLRTPAPAYAHAMRIGISNADGIVGVSNDNISFYYNGTTSYNKVYAEAFILGSDRNIKSNIETLSGAMDAILKLRSVSYFLNEDVERGTPRTIYGFVSQEVQEFLPHLTSEQMGILCLDYTQIIPLLVSGMQEQQAVIQGQNEQILALQDKLIKLENLVIKMAGFTGMDLSNEDIKTAAVLYQNKPNPFKDRTVVKYDLPETYTSASIMVFDMTGTLLETYPISKDNGGEITIEGRQFKPGMYLYSLIVDNVEVDTKKMILSE